MKRLYQSLPGPAPVKILLALAIVVALLIALGFLYDWVGGNFLDTGGTIG